MEQQVGSRNKSFTWALRPRIGAHAVSRPISHWSQPTLDTDRYVRAHARSSIYTQRRTHTPVPLDFFIDPFLSFSLFPLSSSIRLPSWSPAIRSSRWSLSLLFRFSPFLSFASSRSFLIYIPRVAPFSRESYACSSPKYIITADRSHDHCRGH